MTDNMNEKLAAKLAEVVDKARETFTDLWAERADAGGSPMSEDDKRLVEKLFSSVVNGHVVTELMALTSYRIYAGTNETGILTKIVPSLLGAIEDKTEELPNTVSEKVGGLDEMARNMLEASAENDPLIRHLLQGVAEGTPLRVSFNAVVLGLLER